MLSLKLKYKALQDNGDTEEGIVESSNPDTLLRDLKRQGLFVVSIEPAPDDEFEHLSEDGEVSFLNKLLGRDKIPVKVAMLFFKQLSIMLKSGINLTMAISSIAQHVADPALTLSINRLSRNVDRGISLSDSMQMQGRTYDARTIAIIGAGEESGQLDKACANIAILLEKRAKIISKVKSAMFYPTFVILFAIAVFIAFLTFVLPRFEIVFKNLNVPLPAMTRAVFTFGNFVKANGHFIIGIILALIVAFIWARKDPEVKASMDAMFLRMPVIRQLIMRGALASSTNTLASLVGAGVPILKSLDLAASGITNKTIREAYEEIRDAARAGRKLGEAAYATNVFPPLICQMITIGEDSGELEDMLGYISTWYDEELDTMIGRITSLIEPIMICFIAMIVLVIAIAIFGPITTAVRTIGLAGR